MLKSLIVLFVFCSCFSVEAGILLNRVSQWHLNKEYYIVEFFVIEMNDSSEISDLIEECRKSRDDFLPYYRDDGILQINGKERKYKCNFFLIKSGEFFLNEISLRTTDNLKMAVCFSGRILFINNAPVLDYTYKYGDSLMSKGNMTIELNQITFLSGTTRTVSPIRQ